jgi:hypothetical protein
MLIFKGGNVVTSGHRQAVTVHECGLVVYATDSIFHGNLKVLPCHVCRPGGQRSLAQPPLYLPLQCLELQAVFAC